MGGTEDMPCWKEFNRDPFQPFERCPLAKWDFIEDFLQLFVPFISRGQLDPQLLFLEPSEFRRRMVLDHDPHERRCSRSRQNRGRWKQGVGYENGPDMVSVRM